MKFCSRCGSIMRLKSKLFICDCGKNESCEKSPIIEKLPRKQKLGVALSDINPLAVFSHTCSICGFGKAQIASKGVQYTDEDEDVELICGSCGHHDKPDGLKIK